MSTFITLNNVQYDLVKSTQKLEENLPNWERDIFSFLVDWFTDSDTISVQTSGSTGTPKLISKSKSALRNSAIMTGEFFEFASSKNALLCLPAKYIAGKMMLVRAIEWKLSLDYIEPKTQMNIPEKDYYFSAMTPPQVEANLDNISNIKNLIIGGAPITSELENKILNLKPNCYATYGMTETVSHIALRKIGVELYQCLSKISISKDERGCLVINAPKLISTSITTNDLVDITNKNQFIWQGRIDHVINSGGVKISPEIIEKQISEFIDNPFFISSLPDKKWGEKVILIIKGTQFDSAKLSSNIKGVLPKTHVPKEIYFVENFQYTGNGKLKRKETAGLIR